MIVDCHHALGDVDASEEIIMAEEASRPSQAQSRQALAMPPDSAATQFEAICGAFSETARGRWFLDEFARRSRNADTAMVLDAVNRIEGVLSAQHTERALEPVASAADLTLILDDARAVIQRMSAAMSGALGDDAAKGIRIVQEIAWRLRESGTDIRICDILEAQANAIDAARDAFASGERDGIAMALDQLAQRIAALDSGAPRQANQADGDERADQVTPAAQLGAQDSKEDSKETPHDAAATAPAAVLPDAPIVAAPAPYEAPRAPELTPPVPAEDVTASPVVALSTTQGALFADERDDDQNNDDLPALSLGAALIAHGIVAPVARAGAAPLAAYQRMSQAETIAVFS